MGAHPTHGRSRPCSRHCCEPNTRATEREHVRREVRAVLDELAPREPTDDGGRP